MKIKETADAETGDAEESPSTIGTEPPPGSVDWVQYRGQLEGHLPSPVEVGLRGATRYACPPLQWYNFDVYPHKIKLTNTGHTLVVGAKWTSERPYLCGGPLREKHVFSQMHFHWGSRADEGSEHAVDRRRHPAELHVTFFKAEYLNQSEAIKHRDGLLYMCFLVRLGVSPDPRLQRLVEGLARVREPHTATRVGPHPLSDLIPTFHDDYLLYWGALETARRRTYVVRWLISRAVLYATMDQLAEFRKLLNSSGKPILNNFRPLQERGDRHVFFISPHWSQHNTLLPIPRVLEPSVSILSPVYQNNYALLPPQNAYMIPKKEKPGPDIKSKKSKTGER